MLTPINMAKNWAFIQIGFIVIPENRGNQCVNAAKMANTAPILRT